MIEKSRNKRLFGKGEGDKVISQEGVVRLASENEGTNDKGI